MLHDVGLAEVGAARREGHRDQAVVGAEVLLPEPPRVGTVRGQDAARVVGPEPPVHERRVAEPVGEHRPDLRRPGGPWMPASAWSGVFMMCDQSTSVVMPALMHSSAPHRFAGVDVVRPVVRGELVEDRPEVRDQRVVRGARPDRRLPRVAMGVDEARDDDVAGRVDHLRPVRGQVRADGGDRVALDEHVGSGQLAQGRVLGEHDPVLDEDPIGHGCLLRDDECEDGHLASFGAPPPRRGDATDSRSSWATAAKSSSPRPLDDAVATISRLTRACGTSRPSAAANPVISRRSLAARSSGERDGRAVRVEERRPLVAHERRPDGAGGEDVVGGGRVDARPTRRGRAPPRAPR